MQAVRNTLHPVESELQKERAASLGRTGAQLEQSLEAWRTAQARGGDVGALRAEAQKRLWYLVVQREAVGLRNHRDVYELYGIPRAWWY